MSTGVSRDGCIDALVAQLDLQLAAADAALANDYPGDRHRHQPVHTVYVPADRYDEQTVEQWGTDATQTLAMHGWSVGELATVLDVSPDQAAEVADRARRKLLTEPIEDLRIDLEDGYGVRSDDEEDRAAATATAALARTILQGDAPPSFGVRIKSLEARTRRRSVRSLDVVIGQLMAHGALTPGFVITLPKVTSVAQVEAMVTVLAALETAYGLAPRTLSFEIQVETPQAILGADGTALVAPMIHAADGRCTALAYGTYDYSAALGVAPAHQSMQHPVADHAKAVIQVAAAGTGVAISDGSTNVVPTGGAFSIRAAWRLHIGLVRRSLAHGIYQGWDLHPAQLPSRYLATYAFFRDGYRSAAERIRADGGPDASPVLDEPATAAALSAFLLRGVACGALDAVEVEHLVQHRTSA